MNDDDTFDYAGNYLGGDVAGYSTADDTWDYSGNLLGGTVATASASPAFSSSNGTLGSGVLNTLNAIGTSAASIFKNITGSNTSTVYDASGRAVSLPSSLTTKATNVASLLTSAVVPFLPLIGIGLVIWFLFGVFSPKHSRR